MSQDYESLMRAFAAFAVAHRELLSEIAERTRPEGDMADAAVHGLAEMYKAIGLKEEQWVMLARFTGATNPPLKSGDGLRLAAWRCNSKPSCCRFVHEWDGVTPPACPDCGYGADHLGDLDPAHHRMAETPPDSGSDSEHWEAGNTIAMRLLQSDLWNTLDDEERAAVEHFLPKSMKAVPERNS